MKQLIIPTLVIGYSALIGYSFGVLTSSPAIYFSFIMATFSLIGLIVAKKLSKQTQLKSEMFKALKLSMIGLFVSTLALPIQVFIFEAAGAPFGYVGFSIILFSIYKLYRIKQGAKSA